MKFIVSRGFLFCLIFAAVSSSAADLYSSQSPAATTEAGQQTITVSGLKTEDFALSQDGQPLKITAITEQPPSCIGLMMQHSGSMRPKLEAAVTAVRDFVRKSSPANRFMVVNFSDEPYLDQDLTGDAKLIEEGLRHGDARGGSAMYEALTAATDHLNQARGCPNLVLLLVGDGHDNQSRQTVEQTIAKVQKSGHPAIFAAFLSDEASPQRNDPAKRALEVLAAGTGGAFYSVGNVKKLDQGLAKVDEAIRSQYALTFAVSQIAPLELSRMKVDVPGRKNLVVSISGKSR
jgi:Ca-activated chloride channel homolog